MGPGIPTQPSGQTDTSETFPQVCRVRLDNGLGQWSNQYMKGVGSILLLIIALRAFNAVKEGRGTFMIQCYQEKHRSETITHESKMAH